MSSARPSIHALCAAALALGGCGDDDRPPPDAPPLPAWQPGLPTSAVMGERRGLVPARGIIHLHSPYSHDACDGDPRPGGAPDEACLASLRAALCTTRMDFAALTDHDASMADEDFATLFLVRGADRLVMGPSGTPIASRLACADGHQVLLTVGSENPIMPIMLDRHVDGTVAERHATYDGDSPAAVAAFRAAGATVWIAHTEQRTTAELVTLAPDGVEIYNLHANLDPDIRRDFLDLPENGAIMAALSFGGMDVDGPEPDLALLSFLEPSTPALGRWMELLARGVQVAASAGTDAHENTLPLILRDGERGDSYRRLLRWFSNVALVADRTDPAQLEAAIKAGRSFVAFELLGTPVGFDARAVAGATVTELGGSVSAMDGARFELTVPTIAELDPGLPTPIIHARVLLIARGGAGSPELLAEGPGPTLSVTLDRPGAVVVQIVMTPRHLGPYLGRLGPAHAQRELPWIYSNPIYVLPFR